jgi:hypothetical protein
MIMRTGPILIILACMLPLCTCELSFDELTIINWDVYDIESRAFKEGEPQSIQLIFRQSGGLDGQEIEFYQDFDLTRPLNTNKLVYINGKPLSGEGGGVIIDGTFIYIIQKVPLKQGMSLPLTSPGFLLKTYCGALLPRSTRYGS